MKVPGKEEQREFFLGERPLRIFTTSSLEMRLPLSAMKVSPLFSVLYIAMLPC